MIEVPGKHDTISFQLGKPFLICDLFGYAPGLLILVHKPTNLFMAYVQRSNDAQPKAILPGLDG